MRAFNHANACDHLVKSQYLTERVAALTAVSEITAPFITCHNLPALSCVQESVDTVVRNQKY